jgi:hypothetical protein
MVNMVKLQVWVKNLIYDGPDARKAALVLSACTECLATKNDFALSMTDSLMAARTAAHIKAYLRGWKVMDANKAHHEKRFHFAPACVWCA